MKILFRSRWQHIHQEGLGVPGRARHMIVMGTHGHGLLGRALMGSVAQRVVTDCSVPVLLVK
jgi:hypothetical protein